MNKGRNKTTYFRKDYYLPTYGSTGRKTSNSSKTTKTVKNTATKAKQAIAKKTTNKKTTTKKAISRASTSASSRRQQQKAQSFSWREVVLMSLVGTSAAMIAISFAITSIFDPVKRSEHEITKLAEKYYIEYLYPRALGDYLNQPKVILHDYEKSGLPNVRLTQLLSYNNNTNANSSRVFSNSYYQCDLNSTYVKFYPTEPYGPRDFTITYDMACEKPGAIE